MAYIRSRKHGASTPALKSTTAATLLALAVPTAALAAEATLPTVTVTAPTGQPEYKAERVASPKFTEPLLDTPQTVSVITEQLVKEQGATTLTEALRNSPGVSTFFLGENGNTTTGDAIYMRGFDSSSSIYVDGVRDLGSISRDTFNVSQIEVTKGPAGTDYGRSAPTGAINLVTKRASLEDAGNASLVAGDDYLRATADLNRAITAIEGAALRVNVMGQKDGVVGRDMVENNRWGVAGSLAYGLGSPTRAFLDVMHVEQNNVPDGGVPTIGLPGYSSPDPKRPFIGGAGRVDPENFYGTTHDYDDVRADMVTFTIEHDLSPTATLRNTTRWGKTRQDYMLTAFMGSAANLLTPNPLDPSTWTLARSTPTFKNQTNEILTNQTNVTATVQTGALVHDLSGGVEFTREKQTNLSTVRTGNWPAANLYDPDPNVSGMTWELNGGHADGETRTAAVYLFDTIKLNEQWQVNGGMRLERYKTSYTNVAACGGTGNSAIPCQGNPTGTLVTATDLDDADNLFNWKLGVVYKPAANGSIYVNYATSQQPPGGNNFTLSSNANNAGNPDYKPQEARTAEIGTKWDLLDRQLSLTAAIYRTEVRNEVEQDPVDLQYYQTGKKRVQGIELGAVGQITKNWGVSAGFTIMDTKVLSGANVGNDDSHDLNYTPKNAFTAWTSYNLGHGFTVGGGGRYVGQLQRGKDGAVGTPKYVESYWMFDGMASYAVSKNFDVQLNVYNLFDEDYVAAINKSGYRYTPGTPRSARLTASFIF
ncbi:catecholate siderophore receptor Fiu [Chitiniphilus shinanonensis]|uniref:Catecholate siderophore receptor Fiu n=1 Tax=Chitiniphilus shinanonensis TaxID=553088 RepID=A0ABQ6BXP5_9NEIS|nr:catecholate siderophore receptor Fiu [Chitiniphilus shinanonensis]GLS06274.1 catecholate siderophore receptor Fiu [Chitiniphilus shinanonensis]